MHWRLGSIKNIPRNIKRGVKSVIYWFPIIWENNWWDYGYLLDMMNHQIKLMESHWVTDTCHVGDEKIKKQMNDVLYALQRLIKDDYYSNTSKFGDKDYIRQCAASKSLD